jgi:NADH-quinone oxidoreductase subunit C
MLKFDRADLRDNLARMRAAGYDYLLKICATEYSDKIEICYFIRSMDRETEEVVKVEVQADDAWIPTVKDMFKAADWHEREIYEMFGIEIKGSKTAKLLLEKWDGAGYPLRKSFAWGKSYESVD